MTTSSKSKGSKQTRIAISESEWQALETQARFMGQSVSQILAEITRAYLARDRYVQCPSCHGEGCKICDNKGGFFIKARKEQSL